MGMNMIEFDAVESGGEQIGKECRLCSKGWQPTLSAMTQVMESS
jgi:hypothetical protein